MGARQRIEETANLERAEEIEKSRGFGEDGAKWAAAAPSTLKTQTIRSRRDFSIAEGNAARYECCDPTLPGGDFLDPLPSAVTELSQWRHILCGAPP